MKQFLTTLSFIFLLCVAQDSMAPGEVSHGKPAKNALPPLYPTKNQPKTTKPNRPQQKQLDNEQDTQTSTSTNNTRFYLSLLYLGIKHEALFHQKACLCKTIPCKNTYCTNQRAPAVSDKVKPAPKKS